MLTLELHKNKSTPLYMQIYSYIKSEVLARRLKAGTKLPSKRALAAQLGISTITIEGAYGQLMAEGYIYAKAKSGYYISPLESIQQADDSAADFFQHTHGHGFVPAEFCHGIGGQSGSLAQIGFAHLSINQQLPQSVIRNGHIGNLLTTLQVYKIIISHFVRIFKILSQDRAII